LVIAPIGAIPDEAKINDGRTIQPSAVAEFGSSEDDFRLYKVLAARRRTGGVRNQDSRNAGASSGGSRDRSILYR
jgi:hypothetical protein